MERVTLGGVLAKHHTAVTPLYARRNNRERKRAEREWAYRQFEALIDDVEALVATSTGDDLDDARDEEDDMSAYQAWANLFAEQDVRFREALE
jgi:hypothetical protein